MSQKIEKISITHESENAKNLVTMSLPIEPPRKMPKWEVDEDIVISGIAGRFPESNNFDEYANNLFANIDMVTEDDRRWPKELNGGIGNKCGKIPELDKFDATFFSTLSMLGDAIDPGARILCETTYECIIDAGINPQTLRGSRTGVYIGVNTVACAEGIPQDDFLDVRRKEAALWVQGSAKALFANRISFIFDFNGPSAYIDTACSSSLVAFANALQDIRLGNCDMAIVGSANICQAPFSNHIYQAIGLLASDGKCKVWDKRADGFIRSETIACLLLQKKSEAKRIYSTVIHAKTNTDGFKSIGIFSPFWLRQRNLMIETYQEAGVNPHDVKFFEAHATGTNVGDPQETKAIDEAYCSNGRRDSILLGGVKSNLGHSEGASGLCSLGKVIVAFEHKCIPANLHFKYPKPEIESVVNKRLIPVMENTPFDGGIVGVNSFGVGGVNAHALLKSNEIESDENNLKIADTIPRLVNICGRSEESVNHYFDFIEKNPNKVTRDFLAILGDTMKTKTQSGSSGFPYRGYMIIKEKANDDGTLQYEYQKTINPANRNTSVWLAFSGMGNQWTGMAKDMMMIETFSKSITRAANVLKPYNVNLMNLLLSDDESVLTKDVKSAFVSITAMQIALYDLIKELNIPIEGIVGHSFGEIACAYADGCLTLEQAMLTSYWRGKVVEESTLPRGMLAAVGLSWEETIKKCPPGIVAACHNGADSVTISGLYDNMSKFIEQLKAENIFVRSVAGGDYPYHSPFMKAVEKQLIDSLSDVIREPKQRSEKWISTSFDESQWGKDDAKFASGHYFTNNLVSPVLFNEAMSKIPKNSVVIEVAPHSLFESIFKRCFPQLTYVGIMKRKDNDNLNYILSSIGKVYSLGLNPEIEHLYPTVQWPVSRGTQSIGSLIKWDHSHSFAVKKYPEFQNFATAGDYIMKVSLADTDWLYLKDHAVDGRVIFPATGYLLMAWRRIAAMKGQPWMKTPVVFENVRFIRPTLLSEENEVKFTIRINEGTGDFTISEGNAIAATGNIIVPDDDDVLELQDMLESNDDDDDSDDKSADKMHEMLYQKDIYKELRIRGYDYGPKFQGLIEARGDGKVGKCQWTGQWISFLDSVMHLALLSIPIRTLFVPVGFQSIRCDPNMLFDAIESAKKSGAYYVIENEQTEDDITQKIISGQFVDENNQNDVNIIGHAIKEERPDMSKEESKEAEELVTQQLQATLKIGEESMASDLFGIKNLAKDKNDDQNVYQNQIQFPVKFDFNLRAIVTKGIEVKGIIPVNVARRVAQKGLTIEKYEFIPNNEEYAIDEQQKHSIVEYIEVCCNLMKQLLDVHGNGKKLVLNGYKEADDDTVHKYIENPKDNFILLKLITKLISYKTDENLNIINGKDTRSLYEITKEELSNPEYDLSTDFLNIVWANERLIRPFLDICLENCGNKNDNLKILEMNSSNGITAINVINTIKSSTIGLIGIDYTVANPTPLNLSDAIKSGGIKTIEWNTSNHQFLNDISGIDLLIYKTSNKIIEEWNIDEQTQALSNSIKERGFLLLTYKEKLSPPEESFNELISNSYYDILSKNNAEKFIKSADRYGLKLIGRKSDSITSSMILFRKVLIQSEDPHITIKIGHRKYNEWLEILKEKIHEFLDEKENDTKIWIIANDSTNNGIVGLSNCLHHEPGGNRIRMIFDPQQKLPSEVDFQVSPFKELKLRDLCVNIYKNGQWGTYRHTTIPEEQENINTEHAYFNVVTRGDIGSLKWFDAHHKHWTKLPENERNPKEVLCNVYYSALNFKDVVLVSGKIAPGPESALFDCIIGLEFAGRRTDTGERVMGMVPFKGIATTLITYKDYLWNIPDEWSLEEAATVPVVYCTSYYALITRGNLKRGESVLIHSGAGGVGQSAIHICQSMNCEVFTTVGNNEKREFLKKKFNLDDNHIGNSHDTSFERLIMKVTKGKGVNVVLNSLTEDKLQASVRCLAANGKFLEIGKYDMQMNKNLGLFAFLQNISFHGVGLDVVFREGPNSIALKEFMEEMTRLLNDGIKRGVVKPIERTTFEMNRADDAFRYMTTGKHIGKVLIRIRDEENEKIVKIPKPLIVSAATRTWFYPSKVYIIIGGLGGCGLELAYWMVLRGAKKLVLTSRNGIKNAYQQLYLKRFKEYSKFLDDYQIEVTVITHNASTIEGANNLINDAEKYGPIGGVFNLALVLNDAFLENQTIERFEEVCDPKVEALMNLDKITREKCPVLDHFVAFSSLTSGRGNGGQINYGYANSSMERICEDRREKSLPGIAIQFGPIGDVGIVAEQLLETEEKSEMMKAFGGLILQRFPSCLEVLDRFMQTSYSVVSSIVKADLSKDGNKSEDEVLEQLCNHLGIDKRPAHETLGEAGLESMMALEIQQRLERDYDIQLPLSDIKKISVGELRDFRDGNRDGVRQYAADIKKARSNLAMVKFDIPADAFTYLNDVRIGKPVFFLPPIEGIYNVLEDLAKTIDRPVIALNWNKTMEDTKFNDIKSVALYYKDRLKQLTPEGDYDVIGHSFGALIGIHLVRKRAPISKLIMLDPSELSEKEKNNDERFELLFAYLQTYIPIRILKQVEKEVMEVNGENARVTKLIELLKYYGGKHLQGKDINEIIKRSFERADMVVRYKKKNLAKVKGYQMKAHKMITKKMTNISTDVTFVKLIKSEDEVETLKSTLYEQYGLTNEVFKDFSGVHTIIGSISDFLSAEKGNFQKICAIVKEKLS